MRNINLLPRKNYVEQNFMTLLVVMISAIIALGFVLLFYNFSNHSNMNAEQQKIEILNKRISKLNALHQVDPKTEDYNNFAALVNQLKDNRRNWIPIFELIASNLFETSRLVQMVANDKEELSLQLEFTAIREVAEYSILLQKSSLVDKVSIDRIIQATKNVQAINPAGTIGSTNQPLISQPSVVIPEENPITMDELIKQYGSSQEESSFEGDQLLNQLQDIINKQSVKQQFGIDLPSETSGSSTLSSLTGTPFSPEEIENAQKTLNELKQKKLVPTATAVPNSSVQVDSNVGTGNYLYYSVSISIKLKSLPQGKSE